MTMPRLATVAWTAPYIVWMAMMFALPASAGWYAARSLAVFGILASGAVFARIGRLEGLDVLDCMERLGIKENLVRIGAGVAVGVLVCVLWIVPEPFLSSPAQGPSPYEPSVCGWTLTFAKLVGSSFVIAPAEEMFFRGFLYRWLMNDKDWTKADPRKFDLTAFLWVVALFALEHNTRILQGAMAGAFYGYLAIRKGLVSAIVAHAATNLLLALYVIRTGSWGFW